MRRHFPRMPSAIHFRFQSCLVAGLLALTIPGIAALPAQTAPWPTSGWAVSTPETRQLDPAPLLALHHAIDSGRYGKVDRMVVIRDGWLVQSRRYRHDYRVIGRGRRDDAGCGEGACQGWRGPPAFNYYDPDLHPWYRGREIHTLQSVTKSVTSALIGVAIRRGAIQGTGESLLSLLSDYDLSRTEQRFRRAILDDLLTMRTGIEWHEGDRPLDSTNTTLQLEWSPDWVRFTLAQPMDADPGTKWVYNSGGSHLMSAILRKATGLTADRYAEAYLFAPLGIRDYHWKRDPTGLPDTEGGLYLEAEQLAKIGWLYLNDGLWDGTRILPEGWVAASTARRVEGVNQAGFAYGYQWWRVDRNGEEVWAGLGFGGQFLLVLPRLRMVGVVDSWNVWGERLPGILYPFLDAMVAAGSLTKS
jgi:CubicO group peptidase (beta-lactamase class C family)